jgi:hypothetical protein
VKFRNILIGCGVLLVLCIVVSIGGYIVLAPTLQAAVKTVTDGPYQIAKRPLPSAEDKDTLLPATVGNFKRGDVTAVSTQFAATYTNGSETVVATVAIYGTLTAAQDAVKVTHDSDPSLTTVISGLDPSYTSDSITAGKATKLAYSRGKYFFYFNSPSADSLDKFMQAFPF